MKPHPLILFLVRFGLPIVVGIHYLASARGLGYVPDAARGGALAGSLLSSPWDGSGGVGDFFSPLWTLVLSVGASLGLEPLLAAKILGLVCTSCGVIAVYMLAVEVLGDRVLAFLAALVSGLEPGLLAFAPTGTPWGILFALTYAFLFSIRRGEFAMGGIIIGLAGLVAWQAIGLFPALVVEAFRGGKKEHPAQTSWAVGLVTAAVLGTWLLVATLQGWPLVSGGSVPGEIVFSIWMGITLPAGLIPAALGWKRTREFPLLRLVYPGDRLALIVAIGWGSICALLVQPSYLSLLGPLVVILALDGIRRVFPSMYREPISYSPAIYIAGAFLVLHLLVFFTSTRPEMSRPNLTELSP